ncbi:MAG: GNAT family N-acetyltransferase [Gammaproteobacteria bacterium]|nr:GNAT family N-acetyltransferase [Gammaproteobacteria bacterium]
MPEPGVAVRRIDFADAADMARYLAMLDAYARDPMGASRPLADDVRARLARDLPRHPTAIGLLAERHGVAVGFATCFAAYSTFAARPLLNVHDIAVVAEWRGHGVADALLDAVARQALAMGCCRITLEVRADNPRARRVYQRNGFVPGDCELFLHRPL